jgi:ribA/ribD-fused uncharacterized protein
MINRFIGPYEKLSNFTLVIIYWKGIKFPSVEHAYVASKSLDPKFWRNISQIDPKSAGLARKLGRNTKIRPDWNDVKVSFMEQFLIQKFNYDKFKVKLISTGDEELIEGNWWHDNFWGNCSCKKCSDIEGQNTLGKLLMKIRGDLL